MTRSIPVSKTSGIRTGTEPGKRGTQLNFYSQTASIQKPMTQSGARKALDSQTRTGDESGNTSVHSYSNQLKGFTQAQSALQNYMRNRVSLQNEKGHQSYFNDESLQTQPIGNATIYRAKKPNANNTMVMKHHVVSDGRPDANSLQNLFSINSMNVTVGGANKSNNFFLAKDQLRPEKKKPNMIKIGPVARGITIQQKATRAANHQQVMLPYQDASFNTASLNGSQVEVRSGSVGRAGQGKMAATLASSEPWVVASGQKILKGGTQTKYNFHPKN